MITYHQMNAQGCSDAGFCTIEGFSPLDFKKTDSIFTSKTDTLNNIFKIGGNYGKADNDISTYSFYISYNKKIATNFIICTIIIFYYLLLCNIFTTTFLEI